MVGVPDEARGMLVKAFVVLATDAGAVTAGELQDFVKPQIAPYKYPRASSSSTSCRAPRPASCSGSGCGASPMS